MRVHACVGARACVCLPLMCPLFQLEVSERGAQRTHTCAFAREISRDEYSGFFATVRPMATESAVCRVIPSAPMCFSKRENIPDSAIPDPLISSRISRQRLARETEIIKEILIPPPPPLRSRRTRSTGSRARYVAHGASLVLCNRTVRRIGANRSIKINGGTFFSRAPAADVNRS